MARVSLIPLVPPGVVEPDARLRAYRDRLEAAGHSVEVVRGGTADGTADAPRRLVAIAVDRIRASSGDRLVVVDLAMGYDPGDVLAVVDRLESSPTALVVATRRGRRLGPIARRLVGTADPLSGLVGLGREAAEGADRRFAPVGSRVACELLARAAGPRSDVEVAPRAAPRPRRSWSPVDDVRHAKRLADERFGNLSRLLQFCVVGASGMVVDLSAYVVLLMALSPAEGGGPGSVTRGVAVARVLAIVVAMTWNFAINRRLTFNDARRGSIVRQYLRYALSNLVGNSVSFAFSLILPRWVGSFARHRLLAAVAGIGAATVINFAMARWFVFRVVRTPRPADAPSTRADPAEVADLRPPHCAGLTPVGVSRPAAPRPLKFETSRDTQ